MDYSIVKHGVYANPTPVTIYKNQNGFLRMVLFGLPSKGTTADVMAIDYRTLGINLSEAAKKGNDPHRVNNGKVFNEKLIYGAYHNDEDEVSADVADNRVFGEPYDNPFTPEERMAIVVAESRDNIKLSQLAATEKDCADVLLTGSYATKDGTQTFPLSSELLNLSGANLYTKPIETLTAAAKAIRAAGKGMPKMLVMNPDDAANLICSSAMQKVLDVRRLDAGLIKPDEYNELGASYCGSVNVPGCGSVAIYAYAGTYNDNGTLTYFIPQGKALFVPEKVGFIGYCGVYAESPNGGSVKIAAEFGEYYWVKDGSLPHAMHIQIQSCDIPMVTAIDQFGVLTGIPASN